MAEQSVSELQEALGWPRNLISRHLAALRRAGLAQARRDAQGVYYSLVPEGISGARLLVADTLSQAELTAASLTSDATEELIEELILVNDAASRMGVPQELLLDGVRHGMVPIADAAAKRLAEVYRQVLMQRPSLGSGKAEAAAAKLKRIAKEADVTPRRARAALERGVGAEKMVRRVREVVRRLRYRNETRLPASVIVDSQPASAEEVELAEKVASRIENRRMANRHWIEEHRQDWTEQMRSYMRAYRSQRNESGS